MPTTISLENVDNRARNEKWTYFGSRYFDPFFGMWMSPDPAGQFANPYSYGGDPVNFVDPNGEEAITAGVVVSEIFDGANRLQLNRTFSASRFYLTIAHEIGHIDDAAGIYGNAFARLGVLKFMENTPETVAEGRSLTSITEISAISKEFNHRYSQYWSFNTQKYALDRYLRNVSLGVDGSDLSPWRFSY